MDSSNFMAESHVAQQSRRDKLRVQQSSTTPVPRPEHLADYPGNLEHFSFHQELNPDLVQDSNATYANLSSYNPVLFSPEMLNFTANSSQALVAPKAVATTVHQQPANSQSPHRAVTGGSASFANSSSHPIPSVFNAVSKVTGDPQNCGTWKNIGLQQSCDWIVNYPSGLTAGENNQNPVFVGEGLPGSVKVNNISSSALYLRPGFNGYRDLQSSLTNPSGEVVSSQNSQKHYEDMHFNSPPFYHQNAPLAVVAAGAEGMDLASLVQQNGCRDGSRGSWTDGGSELLLLPMYGDQSETWMRRPGGGCNQWSGELGFLASKSSRDLRTVASDSKSNTQSLSLSLSPVLPAETPGASHCREDLDSGTGVLDDGSKTFKYDYVCSNSKPPIGGNRALGNTCQEMAGSSSSAFTHRNTGPLGPFTGYATILKVSKFLKPAQQLLDDICSTVTTPKPIKTLREVSGKVSNEIKGSTEAINPAESMVGAKGGDSGASSSTFYGSDEIGGEVGVRSSSSDSHGPEYQQKKAKLLFMQEEVCRRYKQYHQQMQMVVSSFESVAGLSSATPYVSLALKTVSRHFRCLKNAISDQLKRIRKALGEDLSSPTTGASSSKGDTRTSPGFKFIDHSYPKPKSGVGNLGFFEPQQHVWRPQRGLPERSVAILRSWLFEHFLHPYPTDTDKHMLATRTGLSRNQVSNWFINARVRLWKPMVEEIHTLETKGLAETNPTSGRKDGKPRSFEGASRLNDDLTPNKLTTTSMSSKQVECLRIGAIEGKGDGKYSETWNREKRSRVECQIPAAMDDSLMGFVPYQGSGLEIGGLGAVSLTLGLRQSADSSQQQQLQQQEHQLRQHFGGQMIRDFVG